MRLLKVFLLTLFALSSSSPSEAVKFKEKLETAKQHIIESLPHPKRHKNNEVASSQELQVDEETQMRSDVRKSLPLAQRSFIDPLNSFKVGKESAHQMSPLFLSTFYKDGKGFFEQTGAGSYDRMKGSTKMLLLIEAQYVLGIPVHKLPEQEQAALIEERFYSHFQEANPKVLALDPSLDPILKKARYSISFKSASADALVFVFDRLTESLIGRFLDSPILSPSEVFFAVPDDSRRYTPHYLLALSEDPVTTLLTKSVKGVTANPKNVASALLLIKSHLEGTPLPKDDTERLLSADQLYKDIFGMTQADLNDASYLNQLTALAQDILNLTMITKLHQEMNKSRF